MANHSRSLQETAFVIHRHSHTSSQLSADVSSHSIWDTGKASKYAVQIVLNFLFRKSLPNVVAKSEGPRTAGVHRAFVGHF